MNRRSTGGVRAAWISIVLLVVSIPHAIEDFTFGEPTRVGVPASVALTALLAAYIAQLFGSWLALRGSAWGGRIVALMGAVWVVGAIAIHGPEIRALGVSWRFGIPSIGGVALIVVAGALAIWYGALAAQTGSRSA